MSTKPSHKALTTFATAARLESFKATGVLLHVSPSAVSHQIKAVEQWLGHPLFERSTRRVTLTPRGKQLSAALQHHYRGIDEALERAQTRDAPRTLHISTLPLFAHTWLLPRLADFEFKHPGISITLDTVNAISDLEGGKVDIGIRNTRERAKGLTHRKLIDVQLVPLCSPEFARKLSCEDVAKKPLIAHAGRPNGWKHWLKKQGVNDWPPPRLLTVDTIPGAIAAAAEGAGLMLGLTPFIWEAKGVELLHDPVGAPLLPGGEYTLVHRKNDSSNADVQAFAVWIQAALRSDYHRLLALPQNYSAATIAGEERDLDGARTP